MLLLLGVATVVVVREEIILRGKCLSVGLGWLFLEFNDGFGEGVVLVYWLLLLRGEE